MSFYANYPVSGIAGSNASVGTISATAPTSATLVGGINPSGNLVGLNTDASGNLIVSPLTSSSIVTANQGTAAALSSAWPVKLTDGTNVNTFTANGLKVDGSAVTQPISATQLPTSLGAKTTANSMAVNIASDQTVPVSLASSPLPTGAATSANQTNGTQKTQIVDGSGNVIASTSNALNVSSSTAGTVAAGTAASKSDLIGVVYNTTLPTLTNTQQAAAQADSSGRLLVGSIASALPAGANTIGAVTQASGPWTSNITQFGGVALSTGTGAGGTGIPRVTVSSDSQVKPWDGTNTVTVKAASTAAVATDTALVVAISPNNSLSNTTKGTVSANAPVYNAYSSTNIGTSTYVQLVASTTNVINTVHIFDSSGQAMIFATGASGSEVIQLYVPPGGDTYTLTIPASTRIAYKALTATANSGYLLMSFLE